MRSSLVLLVLTAGLAACVYDNDPPRRISAVPPASETAAPPPPAASGSTTTPPSTPTTGSPSPMLVEVDTDQTMVAVGGEGVGVFVEYRAGGHWHLTWTCDSKLSQQSCDFTVKATASGPITNVDAGELAGGFATSPTATEVAATSTTTNEIHGVKFDTTAGAVLTLEAKVGDLTDGNFLFFVQDGKVNGGFTGQLTNPLQLRGTSP